LTQCKLIINNVEIIVCKSELFKNPIIDFINQEISAERERSIAIVSSTINRQNYDPCQYGNPSLNISPGQKLNSERDFIMPCAVN
jgi:hypothetical protein